MPGELRLAAARQGRAAHRSVTMSRTVPSMVDWLSMRAKRPSSSSHTNLRMPGGALLCMAHGRTGEDGLYA